MTTARRPHIAILGAGPIGLEAALAAGEAGHPFTVYEAGVAAAANVRAWGHVRLFSPWDLNVSPRMRRRLEAAGRAAPVGDDCPTGAELAAAVLEPIAALPEIAPRLRLRTRVEQVARQGLLKHEEIASDARAARPFRLLVTGPDGAERIEHADRVLDCTGTWDHPNSLGDGGIPAPGERALAARIHRSIPDLDREGAEWSGRTVLLAGAGHSAQTAARDLDRFAAAHPRTRVIWALRRSEGGFAVIDGDPLPERSRLSAAARRLAGGASPAIETRRGVAIESLATADGKVAVTLRRSCPPSGAECRSGGETETVAVDRVLSLTGAVGDHRLYRQLQVHECYATCGPMKLSAALLGSSGGGDCLQESSHGVETLVNPEPGFFLLGAKSYGRNPTFLMCVGWQQVDEVFGLLAGRPAGPA